MASDVARYRPSNHFVSLVERAGCAAGRVASLSQETLQSEREESVRAQARLSALLDGSPLEPGTVTDVDEHGLEHVVAGGSQPGDRVKDVGEPGPSPITAGRDGWSGALRIEGLPTQSVAAREYANLLACADLESQVVDTFFDQPLDALTRLHEAICVGLVKPEVHGRLRQTERAIHDGAQGQMLWAAPTPERLPELMDSLLGWLGDASAARPTLFVAAVVHERILEWQPFEAANGRLARSAARIVRRARGLDPVGLAVPERDWWQCTLAYHREVAATMRRRGDLSTWTERIVHAEVVALEQLADRLTAQGPSEVPAQVTAFLEPLPPGSAVAIPEFATRTGVSRERARAELMAARRAGLLVDDAAVAGLRFRVV